MIAIAHRSSAGINDTGTELGAIKHMHQSTPSGSSQVSPYRLKGAWLANFSRLLFPQSMA